MQMLVNTGPDHFGYIVIIWPTFKMCFMFPTDNTYAEEDGVTMLDGDSFFVELQVTNALGYSYTIHSDGVTIQLEPLIPGQVRDGSIIALDLNFQSSTDSLSASWDGFGSDKNPQTFSDYTSGE